MRSSTPLEQRLDERARQVVRVAGEAEVHRQHAPARVFATGHAPGLGPVLVERDGEGEHLPLPDGGDPALARLLRLTEVRAILDTITFD